MQLGWIDFSKEDRQKAFDVINLLSEQGAVDELGIGVVSFGQEINDQTFAICKGGC